MNDRQAPLQPREFALAVECCRWAFAGGDKGAIDALAKAIDWKLFLAVVRRHRVEGLVWHSLARLAIALPEDLARILADDARRIAEHGLRCAGEMARLSRAFETARIPLLFIKGVTLGKLAYANPFLKMGWDIDLLIPDARVAAAAAALQRSGYRLGNPAVEPQSAAFKRWHRKRKESVWYNPDTNLHVELHSRLADNPRLIAQIGIDSPNQLVEVARGIVLPTLADDELFAYLCVHGASSAWFRLKWITDLAALLDRRDSSEIEALYRRSQRLGAGRAANQALLLSARLFGTPIGPALRGELEAAPANRWLLRIALAQMTGKAAVSEPTAARLGTTMIHFNQFLLLPGWRFKASELARQLGTARPT